MLEVDEIKAHLDSARRDFVQDVRIRSYDEAILLYVPREAVGPVVKKGCTSLRQLGNLKKHLSEKFSTTVEIIFVQSDSHLELESSFFQLLNRKFGDQVKSFYISLREGNTVDTWIEVEGLSDELKERIINRYSNLLHSVDLVLGIVQWIGTENDLPTIPAILRSIKIMQPVEIDVLTKRLRNSYRAVDEKWLRRTLDNLRRKGMVHWQKPNIYTLTADSLAFVPAGTGRSSSDVERALALGQRKW